MIIYFAYRFYSSLTLILPLKMSYWLAERIGDTVYFLLKKDKRKRERVIKTIFGHQLNQKQVQKIVRRNLQNFNKSLVDFFRIPKLDRVHVDNLVKIIGQENLDTALKQGNGVVLASLHMGNGGFSSTALALKGYPISTVVWKDKNEKNDRLFKGIRQSKGVKVIYSHNSVKRILRLLKQNEIVAAAFDLNGGKKGIELNLWGRKMSIARGPLVLALQQKAPILPTVIVRQPDDSHKLIIEKPIKMELTQNRKEDLKIGMARLAEVLKKYVIKYPEQWHWLRSLWQNIDES